LLALVFSINLSTAALPDADNEGQFRYSFFFVSTIAGTYLTSSFSKSIFCLLLTIIISSYYSYSSSTADRLFNIVLGIVLLHSKHYLLLAPNIKQSGWMYLLQLGHEIVNSSGFSLFLHTHMGSRLG
jgi:hypothetical protein